MATVANGAVAEVSVGMDCTWSTAGDIGECGDVSMSMSNVSGGDCGSSAKSHGVAVAFAWCSTGSGDSADLLSLSPMNMQLLSQLLCYSASTFTI